MSAAFIATPKVRHLAVWTADRRKDEATEAYVRGAYRAICGGQTRRDALSMWACERELDEETLGSHYFRRVQAAMRRPVCSRCLAALDDLNDLLKEKP